MRRETLGPTLSIRTPEGIAFNLLLAGPVARFLAWLIDGLMILALSFGISKIMTLLEAIAGNVAGALATLLYFVISIGYSIVLEWIWNGQTLGKRLFRLRVMDMEGLRLQFSQVVVRNLLRAVDSLPLFYLVGGLTCFFSRKCQRLGDIAANTIVVRYPNTVQPNLEEMFTGKYNSLRDYPHLEARLRQRVTPAEATAALDALLRRNQLDAEARVQLFAELAAHFRSLVDFPPEAVEFIADEQYVRNVVEVIYRPHRKETAARRDVAPPALSNPADSR